MHLHNNPLVSLHQKKKTLCMVFWLRRVNKTQFVKFQEHKGTQYHSSSLILVRITNVHAPRNLCPSKRRPIKFRSQANTKPHIVVCGCAREVVAVAVLLQGIAALWVSTRIDTQLTMLMSNSLSRWVPSTLCLRKSSGSCIVRHLRSAWLSLQNRAFKLHEEELTPTMPAIGTTHSQPRKQLLVFKWFWELRR